MGLDITALRNIIEIDCVFDEDGEPINPVTREEIDYDLRVYVNPDFPGRADDITGKIYSAEEGTGFRAGSYSGYNAWRNELAKLAGYPSVEVDRYRTGNFQTRHDYGAFAAAEGPFWETINFSDCEGVIGAKVSAKLAADFAEWDDRARAHDAGTDWNGRFYELYTEWRKAYEMAAQNGAVWFH